VVAEDLPHHLVGDEGKIRQVLVNLLGNAVKFTPAGAVTLSATATRAEGGWRFRLEVADTGVGIGPDEMGRLFREFEQTASGRQAGSGTGLGLAISRAYARLMGGEITVASQVGRGSRFTFEFPADEAAAAEVARPASARPLAIRGAAPPPHILLADDQETNRGWLVQTLQAVGFEVREAIDGQGALDACAEGWADLVLLDIRMPGMDGIQAARRIRALPGTRRIPIVALTASGVGEEREAMLDAGADGMLTKPVRDGELLETIRVRLGLEYLYAAPATPPAAAPAALEAGATAALPAALREALRDATRRGDLDRIDELLDQADGTSAPVATALRALASRYDFETLARALD
jgi:CheY-like chemotaxis protein